MSEKDYCPYKTLGVYRHTSTEEITAKFFELRLLHPDKREKKKDDDDTNNDDTFTKILSSYELLINKELRNVFNDHLISSKLQRDYAGAWSAVSTRTRKLDTRSRENEERKASDDRLHTNFMEMELKKKFAEEASRMEKELEEAKQRNSSCQRAKKNNKKQETKLKSMKRIRQEPADDNDFHNLVDDEDDNDFVDDNMSKRDNSMQKLLAKLGNLKTELEKVSIDRDNLKRIVNLLRESEVTKMIELDNAMQRVKQRESEAEMLKGEYETLKNQVELENKKAEQDILRRQKLISNDITTMEKKQADFDKEKKKFEDDTKQEFQKIEKRKQLLNEEKIEFERKRKAFEDASYEANEHLKKQQTDLDKEKEKLKETENNFEKMKQALKEQNEKSLKETLNLHLKNEEQKMKIKKLELESVIREQLQCEFRIMVENLDLEFQSKAQKLQEEMKIAFEKTKLSLDKQRLALKETEPVLDSQKMDFEQGKLVYEILQRQQQQPQDWHDPQQSEPNEVELEQIEENRKVSRTLKRSGTKQGKSANTDILKKHNTKKQRIEKQPELQESGGQNKIDKNPILGKMGEPNIVLESNKMVPKKDPPKCDVEQEQPLMYLYNCPICKKGLNNKYSFQRHVTGHTAKFPCLVCKKNLKRKDLLIKHTRRMHGGKENGKEDTSLLNKEAVNKDLFTPELL